MNSLSTGISPTINVRVRAVRKAQLVALAKMRGVDPSAVIRDAIDDVIRATSGTERAEMLRVASEHAQD